MSKIFEEFPDGRDRINTLAMRLYQNCDKSVGPSSLWFKIRQDLNSNGGDHNFLPFSFVTNFMRESVSLIRLNHVKHAECK